ncbi:Cadmium, cobalt and zinc/H(+)-K(+) antiporter [Anaerolineae bacterium]|nr:Cadmium, cobalt and zinc/H(+)-K(+) antiporter [Anaerolineae bacterium]
MIHTNPQLERRFVLALGISLIVFLAELGGGFWTGSLALLSDSAHVFLDVFALALSYIALRVAALPADDRHTYGWHRLEVFAALANGVTLLAITVGIFYEAWERLQNPAPIHSVEMLAIAVIGLVANLGVARLLHDHHDDLNTRSAFLHVVGDALASVGVIVGGIIILLTGWYFVDPLISVFIGIVIIAGSYRVLRSSLHILFEGTPEGIAIGDVARAMGNVASVQDVHDLHLWSICSGYPALSAHVLVADASCDATTMQLVSLKQTLAERFNIQHTTIQFETTNCGQETVVCQNGL